MAKMRWTLVVACAAALGACSSGGGTGQPASCTHAPVPTSGPGDVGHLFPVDVGRTWTYEATESTGPFTPPELVGTLTVTVGAPKVIEGEPVSVFTGTWTTSAGGGSGTDSYAVRPAGVYLVESSDAAPPLDQTLPEPILPFSPELAQTTQVTCQHLRFFVEGQTWDTDLTEWISGVATVAELVMPAGTFTDVGMVTRQVEVTLRGAAGTVSGHIEVADYFAPGVGLVLESTLVTAGCYGCMVSLDSLYLTSYAPSSSAEPTPRSSSLVGERARPTPAVGSPEEALVRVARLVAGLRR